MGALTAIGVVISGYLVLVQAARIRLRIALVVVISGASLFSLNKAAFVNMALGLLILIVLNARALRKNKRVLRWVALTTGGVVVVTAVCYAFIEPFSSRINTVLLSFGLQNGAVVRDDRNVLQSAIDRLTMEIEKVLPGVQRLVVLLYAPPGSTITGATLEGVPIQLAALHDTDYPVGRIVVEVMPGSVIHVTYDVVSSTPGEKELGVSVTPTLRTTPVTTEPLDCATVAAE